jgi:DoxX-like family
MSAATISTSTNQNPKWMTWTGLFASAAPALMLLMSAGMKLSHGAQIKDMWIGKLGFSERTLTPVGAVELLCVVLYVIPQTALLGAVLVSCYLGGAVCAHVRIGDPGLATPIMLGVFAWAGLWLRDERVRALLPLRRPVR